MPVAGTVSSHVVGALNTGSAVTTVTSAVYVAKDIYWLLIGATSGAPFTDTTTVSGGGLTWTKVDSIITGNEYIGLFVGYGDRGGTDTTGTLTVTLSRTPTAGRYAVADQLGYAAANPIHAVAQVTGTGTGAAVALAHTAGGGRLHIGFVAHKANEVTGQDVTGQTWSTDLGGATAGYSLAIQSLRSLLTDATWGPTWASNVIYGAFRVQITDDIEDGPAKLVSNELSARTRLASLQHSSIDDDGPPGTGPQGSWTSWE